MNKVILKGNISKDIEKSENRNGETIANFNLAVKREFKNSDGNYDSDFIRCVAFGNNADLISNYFKREVEFWLKERLEQVVMKEMEKRFTQQML